MTKNRFEELSQYLHFSNLETELHCGEENYNHHHEVHTLLSGILENSQKASPLMTG